MRNFDISPDNLTGLDRSKPLEVSDIEENRVGVDSNMEDLDTRPRLLSDLPPEALKYIQQLQTELSNLKDVRIYRVAYNLHSCLLTTLLFYYIYEIISALSFIEKDQYPGLRQNLTSVS